MSPQLKQTLILLLVLLNASLLCAGQQPELVVQAGHTGMIRAMAISSDKTLLASAGADKRIIVWNLMAEKQLISFPGHDGWVFALSFSRDGNFLASGGYDGVVKVWNLADKKAELEIPLPFSITSLAFSPDGKVLVIASADKDIKLWDRGSKRMREPLVGHTQGVTAVLFHPLSERLLSSSMDGTIRFWDLETLESGTMGNPLPQGITGFAFSPDGKHLALSVKGGTIGVFDFSGPTLKVSAVQPQPWPASRTFIDYRRFRMIFDTSLYPAGTLVFVSNTELAFVDGFNLTLWDLTAEKKRWSRKIDDSYGAYALLHDEKRNRLIIAEGDITLIDLTTQRTHVLANSIPSFSAVGFTKDGKTLVATFVGGIGAWNDRKKGFFSREDSISITLGLRQLNVVNLWSKDVTAELGEKKSKDILFKGNENSFALKGHSKPVKAIAATPDEKILASASEDGVFIWNLESHRITQKLRFNASILQFSPNGEIFAAAIDKGIAIWTVGHWDQKPLIIETEVSDRLLFSPRGDIIAAPVFPKGPEPDGPTEKDKEDSSCRRSVERNTTVNPELRLWKVATGARMQVFPLRERSQNFNAESFSAAKANCEPLAYSLFTNLNQSSPVNGPIAFSNDGELVAAAVLDYTLGKHQLRIWNVVHGNMVHNLEGHTDSIRSLAFSPKTNVLASAGWDGTVKLWNTITGQELATLRQFDEEHWVLHSPDGQFDTSLNLKNLTKLTWSWPSDPLRPLSMRVFQRDYYEPTLLQKVLAGEKLRTVRDLSTLNRTQPVVSIKDVRPDGADTVEVTVEARATISDNQFDQAGQPLSSGVFDLRLFRDDRLVGIAPSLADDVQSEIFSSRSATVGNSDRLWQSAHQLKLSDTGIATVTFRHIKLPVGGNSKSVQFSAYAFNSDRVTSESSPPFIYNVPSAKDKTRPKAYVITVGVDANQPEWELSFAAKSAEDMKQALRQKLEKAYEVINISLLAARAKDSPRVEVAHATKDNLRRVLDVLAGKTRSRMVHPEYGDEVAGVGALRAARPQDLVLVYICSHGYVDPDGRFYMVLYDSERPIGVTKDVLNSCLGDQRQTNQCTEADNFVRSLVSGDELAEWWQKIDSESIFLILDSCYSGAAAGKQFKAGPLGDRGLGQMAYDKLMIILAAAQPDRTARATPLVGNGRSLLSDALIQVAETNRQQDFVEWLYKAEGTVPRIYEQLYPDLPSEIQLPVVLDFTRSSGQTSVKLK